MKGLYGILALALALTLSYGCAAKFVEKTVDKAVSTAADKTGKAIGEAIGKETARVGTAVVRQYTPAFMGLYVSYLFTYAFGAGSYWVETTPYSEGEWTKWAVLTGGGKAESTLEKAFLKRTEDGKEWWKVKFYDAESGDTVVLEGLFSPGRAELLRLRAKFPDKAPQEVPVQKGVVTYVPPVELTEESLEGATVGTETVKVPAGTFTARHVKYGDIATGGTVEWYIVEGVPGGLVKYVATSSEEKEGEGVEGLDENNYTLELMAYGSGAESELGSF